MGTNPFQERQEANDEKRRKENPRCRFCAQVMMLPDEKIQMLLAAFKEKTITNVTITDVLIEWGVGASETIVSKHRSFARSEDCNRRVEAGWR